MINNVKERNIDAMGPFWAYLVRLKPREQKLLPAPINDYNIPEPRYVRGTDGKFFNIRTNSIDEVAKVMIEERRTLDLRQKITNSEPVRTQNGVLEMEFSDYNPHARAEYLATQREVILAKEGYNLVFWISPEDGSVYLDGRFNIWFSKRINDNEYELWGKHLDLGTNRDDSLKLGKKLTELGGKALGVIDTVEDLRVQPVGFKVENLDNWLDECRKMMPEFESFWKFIENGDDIKQEEKVKKDVIEAKKIAKGDNIAFQREMERRGHEINKSGNHGSGYLGSENISVLNYKIQVIDGQFYTEPVYDKSGRLICPVCGAEVNGSSSICPVCKINFLGEK